MKKRVMTKADAKSIQSLSSYSLGFSDRSDRYRQKDLVELVIEAHECWDVGDDEEVISIMGYLIDLLITAVYDELED